MLKQIQRENTSIIIVVFLCLMVALIGCKTENGAQEQYQVTFTGEHGSECLFLLNYKIHTAGKNLYQIDDFGFIKFMQYKILPVNELEENINQQILQLQKDKKFSKSHSYEKYGWRGKTINLLIDEDGGDTYNYVLARGNYFLFFTLTKNKAASIEVSAVVDEILTSFSPVSPIISKEGNNYTAHFMQNDRYYQITTPHFPKTFQMTKSMIFGILDDDDTPALGNTLPRLGFYVAIFSSEDEVKRQIKNLEDISPADKILRECKINDWEIKFWYSSEIERIFCIMHKQKNFIKARTLTFIEKEYWEKNIDRILELLSTFKVDVGSPIKIFGI